MSEVLKPRDADDVREAIAWAAAEESPLALFSAGTKAGFGHPVAAPRRLDLAGLCGVVDYQAEELLLVARAATPLAEIEALIAQRNQALAFEPPDLGPLWGGAAGQGTLAGAIACNLSGPRRIRAGAARDHFLGLAAVTGRGEAIRAGGHVVKNVTGYDLPKLFAGSHGTLAVLTEIAVKVLPRPEKTRTVLVAGLDAGAAVAVLGAALSGPHEPTAAAWIPAGAAARSGVGYVAGAGGAVTALRVEGPPSSTEARCRALRELMGRHGAVEELHSTNSLAFWRELRDVAPLLGTAGVLWRLSVPPAAGGAVAARLEAEAGAEVVLDWGGGLVWAGVAAADGAAALVRGVAGEAGGHATLVRAPDALKADVSVFHPQPETRARLSERIRAQFDPRSVLNPGRMGAGGAG